MNIFVVKKIEKR